MWRAGTRTLALRSHRKAAQAGADGPCAAEVIPVTNAQGELVSADGCIHCATTAQVPAGLPPAFATPRWSPPATRLARKRWRPSASVAASASPRSSKRSPYDGR